MDQKAFLIDAPVEAVSSPAPAESDRVFLLQALLMAFLGGLTLNLMPCVFPVLSIKALNLIEQAQGQTKDPLSSKLHGLAYAAGILVSFWALDLTLILFRTTGTTLGWGFQLQSPFVTLLCNILFFMALNLLGIFEIGTSLLGTGSTLALRKGYPGSFFTGVLATVVATPCTAPFMGTALVFALGQTPLTSLLVFSALGIGLALPYCALAFAPSLGRFLPRPGKWMETLKQLLSFPLLGTVIWLAWVLGLEAGIDSMAKLLCGLLALGLGGWIYGRWQKKSAQALALLIWSLSLCLQLKASTTSPQETAWIPFSKSKMSELTRAGKPVLLDFTAAWCITCKVNEKVAFIPSVMSEMLSKGITPMRGDWTNSDPEITQTLQEFGRNGVPLYVLFSGKPGDAPRILPQILTPGIVRSEIEKIK